MTYEIKFTLPGDEALEDLRRWQKGFQPLTRTAARPGLQPLTQVQLPSARPDLKPGDRVVVRCNGGAGAATVDGGEVVVAVTENKVYTAWFEYDEVCNDAYFLSRYTFEVIL